MEKLEKEQLSSTSVRKECYPRKFIKTSREPLGRSLLVRIVKGFKEYRIFAILLSILLPGIWDTVIIILVSFRDIEYLGKLIMGIFASLKGILTCLLQGYGIFGTPLYKPPLL